MSTAKTAKTTKRAAYSHSGCLHCKRLRQKCDEAKPTCTACLNQNHECIYSRSIIMWTPNKKKKKTTPASTTTSNSAAMEQAAAKKDLSKAVVKDESPTSENYTYQATYNNLVGFANSTLPPSQEDQPYQLESYVDTSFLFTEVPTDLVETPLPNRSLTPSTNSSLEEFLQFEPADFSAEQIPALMMQQSSNVNDPPSPLKEEVFKNIPRWTERSPKDWCRIMLGYRPTSFTNELDLQTLLQHVFLRGKCVLNYPFGLDENNPLWKGIMDQIPHYDFLRYAVCAVSANILVWLCKSSEWEPYRRKYMDLCMQSLVKKIAQYQGKTQITALLTTVLLLFSEKSSTTSNKWRLHLRGAFELLRDRLRNGDDGDEESDQLFGFMRTWYSMAETLAWLSSPRGGTMDLNMADQVLDDSQHAYKVEGLVIDGFNTFKGYGQYLVPWFTLTVKKVIAQNNGELMWDDPELVNALQQIEALQQHTFGLYQVPEPEVRQSMRASHKLHCLALRLFIITRLQGYPISAGFVQDLVDEALKEYNQFTMFDQLGVTVHWPTFAIGKCCINIEQRSVIEAKLGEMVAVGAWVAKNSRYRMFKYWDSYDDDEMENLVNDMDSIAC